MHSNDHYRYPNLMGSRAAAGFTLMEVMIAVALMAVIAAVSWRGIDSMLRAQSHTQNAAKNQAVLQTAVAQWEADLDQMAPVLGLPPIDWDGKVFRITRYSTRVSARDIPSLRVVAWSDQSRNGQRYWARWQSTPITDRQQWSQAWQSAQLWSQMQGAGQAGSEVVLLPIAQWQLYYAVQGRWTNPLSSQGSSAAFGDLPDSSGGAGGSESGQAATEGPVYLAPSASFSLPDSIRLQLTLSPESGYSGQISRDWLNPLLGNTR